MEELLEELDATFYDEIAMLKNLQLRITTTNHELAKTSIKHLWKKDRLYAVEYLLNNASWNLWSKDIF